MSNEGGFTYQDFLTMQRIKEEQVIINKPEENNEEAAGGEIEKITKENLDPVENLTQSYLTNLCRVCGSPGNISLHTEPPEVFASFKPTPEARKNKVTIAKMISEIADEPVSRLKKIQ